jgi:hypothetical protein
MSAAVRAAALLLLVPALGWADALTSGTEVVFRLPGQALAPGLYIDVPEGAGALRIEVQSETAGRDVDLVVRSGSPFQVGAQPDPDALFDQAQYRSASNLGEEFVTIAGAGRYPLKAGRWHVGVLNFSSEPADVRVLATVLDEAPVVPIEVVYDLPGAECDVAPWSGERKAAMDRAAELLTGQLQPRAKIRVRACWHDVDEEGVLAYAGSEYLFLADTGDMFVPALRDRYTLFSSAATAQASGTSLCHFRGGSCDAFDIQATFNTGADFYFGLDANEPFGQPDFVATAMHEITHGLGFFGLVDVETGESYASGYLDAYGRHARWHAPGVLEPLPFLELTDAERKQALTSVGDLRLHGPNVKATFPSGLRLYAPATPNPGSTYSHLDTAVMRNQLMAHAISPNVQHELGYAVAVLGDAGWDQDPAATPEALLPRGGQFYDVTRSGHGIAMYRVAGLGNFYFLVFYTYDAAGLPEYYVSSGYLVDGVFAPERTANGDSLVRSLYQAGATPPGYHDASPAFEGLLRIDFNQAELSPACAGRASPTAVMSFTLPGSANQQWCLQSLADSSSAANDLTNVWLATGDTGWGASSLSFAAGAGDGIGLQLYYPDAAGTPRWAIMQTAEYAPGTRYPLLQPRGYCRTCAATEVVFEEVGSITVGLDSDAAGSTGQLDFEVSFDGPAGGTFARDTDVVPGGEAGG